MNKLSRGTAGVLPMPFGIGLMVGGITVAISSIIGLLLDDDTASFVRFMETGLGLAAIVVGLSLSRANRPDVRITRAAAMSMFVAGWVGFNTIAIASFSLSGELGSFLNVVFEAVSASTTTGFTTVEDPQQLSHALRFQRVAMPWATGLGVLLVSLGVLPAAIAGAELLPDRPLRGHNRIVTTSLVALRNILGLYTLLTASLVVGFSIAGMGLFDAFTYAFSTASTGGMANHADSLAHFDSEAIEWVAAAGMTAAGGNLLIVWWAIKGRLDSVFKSTELRLYLSMIIGGFLVVRFAGGSESALSSSDAAVAVTSMLSTTGLRSANWASSADFIQATLLVGAGIGAMSGSVGSGFRQARVARIALEVRRSLQSLLSPARESVVQMDGVAVEERSLELTYGYLWMHACTLAALSVLLFVPGFDLLATLSLTLGLLSNVGVLVDDGELVQHVNFSGWTQVVSAFAMLLGRLSIYPVLLTLTGFVRWLTRLRPHRSIGART